MFGFTMSFCLSSLLSLSAMSYCQASQSTHLTFSDVDLVGSPTLVVHQQGIDSTTDVNVSYAS